MIRLLLIAILFTISSCGNHTETNNVKDSTYIIEGSILDMDTGWVYFYNWENQHKPNDTCKIDKGKFSFKGTTVEPQFAEIGIIGKERSYEAPLSFFVEPGTIKIKMLSDSIRSGIVQGGKSQVELQKFMTTLAPVIEKHRRLQQEYKQAESAGDTDKITAIEQSADALDAEYQATAANFAREHPASYISAVYLARYFGLDPDPKVLEPLYEALDGKIKSSYHGEQIKAVLESAKKTAVGAMAPEISAPDVTGKAITLSSLKGKYTLVDFWASWCGPCRTENPVLVEVYNKYKTKEFEILGISLDEKNDDWQKAIKEDKLLWTQVSDLKGWQSNMAASYGVKFIPMNFLLDKDGKIIAKNLRGKQLAKKLEEILN